MEISNYIKPTKQNPVFVAKNSYWGYIEQNVYKMWNVKNEQYNLVGCTFAVNYADAINNLHDWIIENKGILNEVPKCNFTIQCVDGTVNKFGEPVYKKVYTISASKAKKYLL